MSSSPLLFLSPTRFRISRGTFRDYLALSPFHYRRGRPATVAGIWVVRYRCPLLRRSRVVAVAVLSWPVPSCSPRERFLGRFGRFDRRQNLRFANQNVRTISRVIVHPQFRSIGLGVRLVHWVCLHCDTRYVEAMASMGRAHPLFERAGMTRVDPDFPGAPVYYVFDRRGCVPRISSRNATRCA